MTSKIDRALHVYFGNFDYRLSNSYVFSWESDFFGISTSGYCYEVEVKVSRSDYKADFKKTQKHFLLKNSNKELVAIPGYEERYIEPSRYGKEQFASQRVTFSKAIVPNKFYYACPEGLIKPEEIPEYAGLFYFDESRFPLSCLTEVKRAKFLNKNKYLDNKWFLKTLLDKFYYRSMNLRTAISEAKRNIESFNHYYHEKEDQKTTLF